MYNNIVMEIVKNNISQMPVKPIPEMFCFGGYNVSIEKAKIKTVEQKFYQDYETETFTPILVFTMQDDTTITVDYDSEEEAEKALKIYKKSVIKAV